MPPTVSVIIPAYNRAATIVRSIQSVLAQTLQDLELIIVDDGSTDQTRKVAGEIRDERIRLICHERNLGAAAARNTGMKAATGKYVAWLDSDDEWLPEKLQIQLEAFGQATPDQKASYTAYERIEWNGSRIYIPKYADYKRLFLSCDQAPGSSLLFERTLLDEIGYLDVSLKCYEDWDWMLRYCSVYRLLPVNQPLTRVYYTPARSSKIVEASAHYFVLKYSDDLRQFGTYRNIVISRRWMEVASYYAHEHNIKMMILYTSKAMLIHPFQPLDIWAWLINSWFGIKIGQWLHGRARTGSTRTKD